VVLDACVLYRPALRRMLLTLAAHGGFRPIWSERLWDEWERARLRAGDDPSAERAAICAAHPAAMVAHDAVALEQVLAACDRDAQRSDAHVVATAIGVGRILTFNLADFPPRLLRPFGVVAETPVAFAARLAVAVPGAFLAMADAWEGGRGACLRHLADDLRLRRCARILATAFAM